MGQNLYIYKQSIRLPPQDWERAVTDWYDEVALFSNKKVITDMWDSTEYVLSKMFCSFQPVP